MAFEPVTSKNILKWSRKLKNACFITVIVLFSQYSWEYDPHTLTWQLVGEAYFTQCCTLKAQRHLLSDVI